VGFEPTISADERPQTYVLDRAATGTGCKEYFAYVKAERKVLFIYYLFILGFIVSVYFRTTDKADTPGKGSVSEGSLETTFTRKIPKDTKK
jgi:hypothetical protein